MEWVGDITTFSDSIEVIILIAHRKISSSSWHGEEYKFELGQCDAYEGE
jgi:hypothetical protein